MNYKIIEELTPLEFDSLRTEDWVEISEETFGEGRGKTTITIVKSGNIYVQAIEEFGFDDFVERYNLIEIIQ